MSILTEVVNYLEDTVVIRKDSAWILCATQESIRKVSHAVRMTWLGTCCRFNQTPALLREPELLTKHSTRDSQLHNKLFDCKSLLTFLRPSGQGSVIHLSHKNDSFFFQLFMLPAFTNLVGIVMGCMKDNCQKYWLIWNMLLNFSFQGNSQWHLLRPLKYSVVIDLLLCSVGQDSDYLAKRWSF